MKPEIRTKARPWELVVLAVALLILAELTFMQQWSEGYFGTVPVIRVAATDNEWVQSGLFPAGPGFEQEMLDRLCEQYNMRWVLLEAKDQDEAWQMLSDGRADVVIGQGSTPPERLSIPITASPAYASFKPVLVYNDRRHGVKKDCDMCERPILTTANVELQEALLTQAKGMTCTPRTVIGEAALTPLLETLEDNRARFALVDEGRFRIWQPFFNRVRAARELPGTLPYHWYWSEEREDTSRALEGFWARMEKSSELAVLYDRYFGFLPEKADHFEIDHFLKTLHSELPQYAAIIQSEAKRNNIDPLLLVAVIYQESMFQSSARSKTGVRGLMQLTQGTAKLMGVNRLDPVGSIRGGARYLRQLFDGLAETGLDDETRWLFALAAYNRGPGHLNDAVALSQRLGGQGDDWLEIKKSFKKLSYERWYKNAKHGYTRGFEVVNYVENIRYYRFILNGLITLDRPEAELLAAVGAPATPAVASRGTQVRPVATTLVADLDPQG